MKKLTPQSTIREALQNPRAVAAAERLHPGITRHPAISLFSHMPLSRITQSRRAGISMQQLQALLKEINED